MRRIPIIVLALAAGLGACEEDEQGIEGTFTFAFSETRDTCDGESDTSIAQLTISRDGEEITVRFGDEAVLSGFVNEAGIIEAEGPASVTVEVNGDPIVVESFMEIQIGIRPVRSEASGRLTYDGTHPSNPGEQCVQEFFGTGQRASFAPFLPTGPAAVDAPGERK
ncbi:MAG TPA: hypothetical protein VM737_01825 [Gemmatimonadota bacterium]|nr:hypothetical protein [Gemmatimonadota bacterium]